MSFSCPYTEKLCLFLLSQIFPVHHSTQYQYLNDYYHNQDDLVGEDVDVHLPENLPTPPQLHVRLGQAGSSPLQGFTLAPQVCDYLVT